MPPKAKFTKEEIIAAALEIIKSRGMPSLTARELGAMLGSSARPVFTVFQNMEEVQQETMKAAKVLYRSYVQAGLKEDNAFRGVGKAYIQFAVCEPKLFQLLFMTENKQAMNLSDALIAIDENYEEILLSAQEEYQLDREDAITLYQNIWVYTHGVAALCATKVCRFTNTEIASMLTGVCRSILQRIKRGEFND